MVDVNRRSLFKGVAAATAGVATAPLAAVTGASAVSGEAGTTLIAVLARAFAPNYGDEPVLLSLLDHLEPITSNSISFQELQSYLTGEAKGPPEGTIFDWFRGNA